MLGREAGHPRVTCEVARQLPLRSCERAEGSVRVLNFAASLKPASQMPGDSARSFSFSWLLPGPPLGWCTQPAPSTATGVGPRPQGG